MVTAQESGDYVSWRGPSGLANYGQQKLPVRWGDANSIAWQIGLPGRGGSTPLVVNDHVYVTSSDGAYNLLTRLATDGHIEWTRTLGAAVESKHAKATAANSSPVSDGEQIYAYFKSGQLTCLDLDGTVRWDVNLQSQYAENTLWWDLGTSPVLTQNAVIVAVIQSGPSFLLALDKKDGRELWRTDRQMNVNNESNQSYTTPCVYTHEGQQYILTLGADHVTLHAADDGRELWRIGGFNPNNEQYVRSISSPIIAGDYAICPYDRGTTLTAFRLGDDPASKPEQAWKLTDLGSDVPTPTADANHVYVLGDKGLVSSINIEDGSLVWQEALPKHRRNFSSSPVLAGGNIYCTREDGTTFVVSTDGKLIAENSLEGAETVSTLVPFGQLLLQRSYDRVIAIK